MAKVMVVAEYILHKSKESSPTAVTPLKLQKLLYFAQGFHLALNNGTPLFEEDLINKPHGSKCQLVYDVYKEYEYRTIPRVPYSVASLLTDSEIMAIEKAWNIYGNMDGKFLEELIHQEDPWLDTETDEIMPKEKIFEYFYQHECV